MTEQNEQDSLRKVCSVQEIPKWAERYARNRSLPVLVNLGLAAAIVTVCIAFTLYAVESKVIALMVASIVLNAVITAGTLYLIISGRWMAIIHWPDRVEGIAIPASPSLEQIRRTRRFDWVLPLPVIAILVIAKILDVPTQYWQPMAAMYIVPAIVYIIGRDGWMEWPYLLWPALYLQHAILVLVGVKLYIGVWYIDVGFPLGVYAVAGLIAAHIYSRYTLRKLRDAARQCNRETSDNG